MGLFKALVNIATDGALEDVADALDVVTSDKAKKIAKAGITVAGTAGSIAVARKKLKKAKAWLDDEDDDVNDDHEEEVEEEDDEVVMKRKMMSLPWAEKPFGFMAHIDGERRGPLTYEQFVDLVIEGEIVESTMIWRDGMEHWREACSMPQTRDLFKYL